MEIFYFFENTGSSGPWHLNPDPQERNLKDKGLHFLLGNVLNKFVGNIGMVEPQHVVGACERLWWFWVSPCLVPHSHYQ